MGLRLSSALELALLFGVGVALLVVHHAIGEGRTTVVAEVLFVVGVLQMDHVGEDPLAVVPHAVQVANVGFEDVARRLGFAER
jgi:hypothetical protein